MSHQDTAATPPRSSRQPYESTAYVVVCRDGPDGASVRQAHTQAHLAYIETVLGDLNVAGPLFDAAGRETVGSLYSLRTRSFERARAIIENDPFYKGGAFASVEYFPHLPAAGSYIGGKIW